MLRFTLVRGACLRHREQLDFTCNNMRVTLKAIGQMPLDDFEEYLYLQLSAGTSLTLHAMQRARREQAGPDYWVRDIDTLIWHLEEALMRSRPILPRELVEVQDVMAARLQLRELVRRFGALLECWPDMVHLSKALDPRPGAPAAAQRRG